MASSQPVAHGNSDSVLSVQELIKQPITVVPQRYVHLDLEPPTHSNHTSLPTIDMKQLISGEASEFELEKLHSTCKEWGFFQVIFNYPLTFI